MDSELVAFSGMIFMFILFFVLHGTDFSKYNSDGSKYEYHQASFEIHNSIKHKNKQRIESEVNNDFNIGD